MGEEEGKVGGGAKVDAKHTAEYEHRFWFPCEYS